MHTTPEKVTAKFAQLLGTSSAFLVACLVFAAWLALTLSGAHFDGARVFVAELAGLFVFVHLFIVQRNTNKDVKALHIKLDALIASIDGANNQLIKAECAPEHVIDELHEVYTDLADSVDHPTKPISLSLDNMKPTKRSA